jgi:O-antigen/teichoic acid export membrane protein
LTDLSSANSRKTLAKVQHWFQLTAGTVLPVSDSERRYARIAQGIFTGIASRGLAFVTALVSVPLTIHYLGTERYAAWVLLNSLLVWINLAEFGLGNGMVNAVSSAVANEQREDAQRFVASTFWMLVAIAGVAGVGVGLVWPWLNWNVLFGVRSADVATELDVAIIAALGIFFVSLPLSAFAKVLCALQEARLANLWGGAGNLCSFLGLLAVTYWKGSLVWLVLGYSGSLLLVNLLGTLWLFFRHAPWLKPKLRRAEWKSAWELLGGGSKFFVINIASLLILETDYFIVAHYLDPHAVTQYSVTWRLFSYATLVQNLAVSSLWPAYCEAFARKDVPWIQRTLRTNLLFGVGSTTVLVLFLLLSGQQLIGWWAGSEAVPPFALLPWMGAWSVINCTMTAVSCLLNGSGNTFGQTIYGTLTAIVNVGLSILLVQTYGIVGVIAATVIAYLLFDVGPGLLETMLVLKRLIAQVAHPQR